MQKQMNRSTSLLPLSFVLCTVAASCVILGMTPGGADAAASGSDSRLEPGTSLQATGPHPSLGANARTLAPLVGSWNVEYTDFPKDGKASRRSGQFTAGWILDGRALQDFWVVDPSGTNKEREVFTELFYFDPKSATWHVDSFDPYVSAVATFAGPVREDGVVVESHDLDPKATHRWSFNDVRPGSLVFRDEASSDGGKTWTLKSEYRMTRREDSSPSQGQPK